MNRTTRSPEETYGPALDKARQSLAGLDPLQAAVRAGVPYEPAGGGPGRFTVPFLGALCHADWPGGAVRLAAGGQPVDVSTRLVILHYLVTADGAPMASKWIAFRQLPGGLGYDAAFQGRANQRLAGAFGAAAPTFAAAARSLGGEVLDFGDASFSFRVLPRLWLAVVLYLADDEFPASANVLFDAAAGHYLPTEDLAVLGGLLAGRLIKAARAR